MPDHRLRAVHYFADSRPPPPPMPPTPPPPTGYIADAPGPGEPRCAQAHSVQEGHQHHHGNRRPYYTFSTRPSTTPHRETHSKPPRRIVGGGRRSDSQATRRTQVFASRRPRRPIGPSSRQERARPTCHEPHVHGALAVGQLSTPTGRSTSRMGDVFTLLQRPDALAARECLGQPGVIRGASRNENACRRPPFDAHRSDPGPSPTRDTEDPRLSTGRRSATSDR